jgi:hypothetical protein
MSTETAKFEGWAVVEIFGHQRYAGFVTTEQFGQAAMFRVDVPPLPERERVTKGYEYAGGQNLPPGSTVKELGIPGYSKLFGVGAIYALTPCDQATAEKVLAQMQPRKLQLVKLGEQRALQVDWPDDNIVDDINDGEEDDTMETNETPTDTPEIPAPETTEPTPETPADAPTE